MDLNVFKTLIRANDISLLENDFVINFYTVSPEMQKKFLTLSTSVKRHTVILEPPFDPTKE